MATGEAGRGRPGPVEARDSGARRGRASPHPSVAEPPLACHNHFSRPTVPLREGAAWMSTARFLAAAGVTLAALVGGPRSMANEEMTGRARQFVREYERKIAP